MGILLKDSSGTITTPGFPQGYDNGLIRECLWTILAPAGNVVRVDFISFSLDSIDYVTIADALPGWNVAQSIRRSGQKASFTVFSMGNELSINVFAISSFGTGGPGFVANFTSVPTGKNTRELICVCVCVERDALFMQEIVKLSQSVIRGEWHCWDHFKGEPGCKVLLNFSSN